MNNAAQQEQLTTQPKKSKTILYVGIAVGVVALVGLVIYLKRR
jgi:nitrate reductase gamma subunit